MRLFKQKPKGLAIITTLLVITLLLALVGAFLVINQAGNRFTLNSVERRTAEDVCQSAFSFAWLRLEGNPDWGTATDPFGGTEQFPITSPQLRMTLSQVAGPDDEDGNPTTEGLATGVYSPTGDFNNPAGTFELKVRNNLDKPKSLPGIVPKKTVKIEVVAKVGGLTRNLHALLRPAAISNESLSAGRNLNLDSTTGLLRIDSDDPYVNRIRAAGDFNIPGEDDVRFVKHGAAIAHDRLNVGATNMRTASDAVRKAAGEVSGGLFHPGDPGKIPHIRDFDESAVELPANTSNAPGGDWVFGDITGYEYRPGTVNWEMTISTPGGGTTTIGDTVSRNQRRSSLYNSLRAPNGEIWVANDSVAGSVGEWGPPMPVTLGSPGAANNYGYGAGEPSFEGLVGNPPQASVHTIRPGFKANVLTAQFVVNSGTQVRFDGDFVVTGAGDRQPELYFGYDMDTDGVAHQTSLNNGLEAAQQNPSQHMGALVTDGNLNVAGGVLGYGSMIAGGDLNIKASSGLRTAPELGVVVKGENIIVEPATEPEPALPGEPVNVDYPVFRDAIENQDSDSGDSPDIGWPDYEAWLDHQAPHRQAMVDGLQSRSTGISAAQAWTLLNSEIGGGGALPTTELTANGWNVSDITIDQYVRLKTFYQTRASQYNNGDGDPDWLDFNKKVTGAKGRVESVVNDVAQKARSFKTGFQSFIQNPNPDVPDMYMQGLIYAENDFTINCDDNHLKLEGAVVSKSGDINVNDASKLDLIYNRSILDDLTSTRGDSLPLEKVFFTMD